MRAFGRAAALALALAIAAAGCATFSSTKLPTIRHLPAREGAKPSVRVRLSYENYPYWGQKAKDKASRTRRFEKEMEEVLRQSGYFSSVGTDTPDPDLVIQAQLTDSTDIKRDYGWLTIRSLGVWPCVYHGKYSLRVTATSAALATERDLQLVTGWVTWGQTLLLPLMPFTYEVAVQNHVRHNLYRNLCVQLAQQGILDAATKAKAQPTAH